MRNPAGFFALGLGSGLSPVAPGTFGTLAAIPFFLLLQSFSLSIPVYLLVLAVAFMFGVWVCDQAGKTLGVHDHGAIVWDEFVGYWVTMCAAPVGWQWVLVGFVLFRIFDIWKPWPIRWADSRVSGGFGVMLDDVLAGIYAFVGLQLIASFF